ncbi:MAG: hypothetical protein PHR53_00120 [Bacteroidales bacterium]|nr:hypothetical protein [Bacteroidales bacterium]
MNEIEKSYFRTLEEGISKLPESQCAAIYLSCAINCVKDTVLPILRQRNEICGGDLDQFFSSQFDNEYSFQNVIEKGRCYEFGYPKCFCPLMHSGFAQSATHCECSRQSIFFVLEELYSEKTFDVEMIDTVINGADKCLFRIRVK